jgi:hypothetical protein
MDLLMAEKVTIELSQPYGASHAKKIEREKER